MTIMDANFEIKQREGLARIGVFTTSHGKVNTPTIMPVLDPLKPDQFPIDEMKSIGAEMFITNAYLTYKNETAKNKAKNEGIHALVGYDGPLMTDSGAFQLMGYGQVNITNIEVTEFEEQIGVDIGVYLDVPVAMGTYEETKSALESTLERAREHIQARKNDQIMWAGPIQGGKYLDLITTSAQEMGKLRFDIHAIGSVVPLLESYDYLNVSKMVFTAKKYLPYNRPVHLFGAGHPMVFALAVYLGIDLFDSAAYWLFSKAGRYMTVSGTYHLKDLGYFPCYCKYCMDTSPQEILKKPLPEQTLFLARHNLAVSFGELQLIKQAIYEGRLWNLVLQRSSSHPKLTEAVNFLIKEEVQQFIETFSSISYKSKLFAHPWSFSDPILRRYKDRVNKRFFFTKKKAVLLDDETTGHIPSSYQRIYLNPIFGLIPEEWKSLYPIVQHVSYTKEFNEKTRIFIQNWVDQNKENYDELVNVSKIPFEGLRQVILDDLSIDESSSNLAGSKDLEIIKSLLKFQFNFSDDILETIQDIRVERSKSDRIKEFFINNERCATIRASDSVIVPSEYMAKLIHRSFDYPNQRVVVNSEVKDFIRDGKSVFSKFVSLIDLNLRPGDECIIVTEEDELIGFGSLLLTYQEAKDFSRGMVVKTRKGI